MMNQNVSHMDNVGEAIENIPNLVNLYLDFTESQVKSVRGLRNILQKKSGIVEKAELHYKGNSIEDLCDLETLLVEKDASLFQTKNGKIVKNFYFYVE